MEALGWEDSPGEGSGYLLQCSSLGNFKDRGAWQAIVHGVVKRQTQLSKEVKDMVERKISQCV